MSSATTAEPHRPRTSRSAPRGTGVTLTSNGVTCLDAGMTATLEPRTAPRERKLDKLIPRINRQSVEKRSDAYLDVAWDDPEMAIGPDDPRCTLFEFDPLAHTDWYQAQTPELQARIGLHRVCAAFKVGMQFENLLQRGLLTRAFRLPNEHAEFRYLHHEVIEESQHS